MQQKLTFKKGLLALGCAMLIASGLYYKTCCAQGPIYEYNELRDTREMVDLFERNLYWLTVQDDSSSFKFYLRHRTHSGNPLDFGRMSIKVLREHDQLIGFITYFMDDASTGDILFVAVNEDFRGKGYAKKLMRYAMDDLQQRGAQKIKLVTRPSNLSGHALYKRLGFVETHSNDVFSYFTHFVKS